MNDMHGINDNDDACSAPVSQERPFTLVDAPLLAPGDCYVALVDDGGALTVRGLFDSATGGVYACAGEGDDPRQSGSPVAPSVRIVGPLDGQTGQVTVLQPDGSYRRFSRWDRISKGSPAQPNAILRTLPQCGCGGSIGMPKLFDSFAQMSAYFFCTFAL